MEIEPSTFICQYVSYRLSYVPCHWLSLGLLIITFVLTWCRCRSEGGTFTSINLWYILLRHEHKWKWEMQKWMLWKRIWTWSMHRKSNYWSWNLLLCPLNSLSQIFIKSCSYYTRVKGFRVFPFLHTTHMK